MKQSRLYLRIESDLKERLERVAKQRQITLSSLVISTLKKVKENKENA